MSEYALMATTRRPSSRFRAADHSPLDDARVCVGCATELRGAPGDVGWGAGWPKGSSPPAHSSCMHTSRASGAERSHVALEPGANASKSTRLTMLTRLSCRYLVWVSRLSPNFSQNLKSGRRLLPPALSVQANFFTIITIIFFIPLKRTQGAQKVGVNELQLQ